MALDGIYTHYLIKELNNRIGQTRLESIVGEGLCFTFQLYKQKERCYLTFNLNASFSSVYLSKKPNSKGDTTNFITSLKKHLEGGILNEITQYMSDRVFIFNFTVYDFIQGPLQRQVIFEAMGRHANLFLLENNKIIDSYKRMFVIDGRHLVPHASFEYFKTDKLDANTYVYDPLLTPKEISNKYLGISLRLAKFLHEKGINPYQISLDPTYSIKENKTYFFNIFEEDVQHFNTLSEALDHRIMEQKDEKQSYNHFIKNHFKKLDKKLLSLIQQKESAIHNLSDKDKGDFIYGSGYDLKLSLPFIGAIALDETKSLSANAQNYYKSYQKAKRSLDFIEIELFKVRNEIEEFNHYQKELMFANSSELKEFREILLPYGFLKQSNKKQAKETKHKIKPLTIKDLDTTYFIGKNALQNAFLIKEIGLKSDYWFHLKDAPGSHVIVRTDNLNEQVIRKAAMIAAYYSSYRDSSSIPINYTLFRNVSRIGGRPASFVKIKDEKTIYIDIDHNLIDSLIKNA